MKKFLKTICTVLLCLALVLAFPVAPRAAYEGAEFHYVEDDGEITITGYNGSASGVVVIPATIYDVPVTRIAPYAFQYNLGINSITLPEGLLEIGAYAFHGCHNLYAVDLPNTLQIIGEAAFFECWSLTEIYIPYGVKEIGKGAFSYCLNLRDLQMEDNLEHMGLGVVNIGAYAFAGAPISSVDFPNTVKTIGESAFAGCESMLSITLPDSLERLGTEAFYNCTNVTSLTVGSGPLTIGERAFADCRGLETVDLGDGVVGIGSRVFSGCYNLHTVNIGKNTSVIDDPAFAGCSGLAQIWVDPENAYYCSDDGGVLLNKDMTRLIQFPAFREGCYTIPNSVQALGEYAFTNTKLTSLIISDNVSGITADTFASCSRMEQLLVSEHNPYYTSVQGVLYNKDRTVLMRAPECIYGDYTVPSTVTEIWNGAFRSCSLSSVVLPEGIQEIGNYTFSHSSISQINIPESVTKIGIQAFFGTQLTSVSIGNNVTSIGDEAFANNGQLTEVYLSNNVKRICYRAFYGCNQLRSITIPANLTWLGAEVFDQCPALEGESRNGAKYLGNAENPYVILTKGDDATATQVQIHPDTKFISQSAFRGFSNLTEVQIPENVISIGDYAFTQCSGLTEVQIPEGVTEIGKSSFEYCTSLTDVQIPESVVSIGSNAFSGCRRLKAVNIPDSVTTVSTSAFHSCENLTSVILPENLTSIEGWAFYDCDRLQSIYIPATVTEIGQRAFVGCVALDHIVYGGTQEQWQQIVIGADNEECLLNEGDTIHYEAADTQHPYEDCIYTGTYCELCRELVSKENEIPGTHTYLDGADLTCEECDYVRQVQAITIAQQPQILTFPMLTGQLDVTGGVLEATYSDGSVGQVPMTVEMVSGFDNLVYGLQELTVTYGECTTTYTVKLQPTGKPDRLEVVSKPSNIIYLKNQELDLKGLVLLATYGDQQFRVTGEDVTVDAVDMSTTGAKTVTVWFNDASASFTVGVHTTANQLLGKSTYPQSAHSYAANTDETKTLTYPGALSLKLTFAAESQVESGYDYVYVMDGDGNEIAKFTGSLSGKQITVPGDTVKIRLVSDHNGQYYGYAFSSIYAEFVHHPGDFVCSHCGALQGKPGETVLLDGDMELDQLVIPAGVTLELDGCFLTVNSLVSFGQITDFGGGGYVFANEMMLTDNEWVALYDSEAGGYLFFDYEVKKLGVREKENGSVFGFALDFPDKRAYDLLQNAQDLQFTVELAVQNECYTFAFSREMLHRYVALHKAYPDQQAAMMLTLTGLDILEDGTQLSVTPAVTANGSARTFAPYQYVAGEGVLPEIPAEQPGIVTAPRTGSAYKLVMQKNGTMLYFTGKTESASVTYRLATSTDLNQAVDVYLEEDSDGYRMYFFNGEDKYYIHMYQTSTTKGTLQISEDYPNDGFRFDPTVYTMIYDGPLGNSFYMGTYSSYTTFSVSNTSYITGSNASKVDVSQFPARLYKVG